MSFSTGTRLGPYEILSPLGAGGMGEVYKARDTRLDRTVAIKVLPAQFADDPEFKERFDREARTISSLDHPHICALYDVGEQNGTAYLVMQYLEGETLETRLKKGALPLDQALKTAIEIADALDKAHRAGITHRDLKPGNIMLTKAGAKLLDFGLAKASRPVAAGAGLSMLPTTPPNLTAQGTILGTFQYMAPEQLEGQEADARTDVFAFGAVVYEMLTGKKAFDGKNHASLISAIMSSDPRPIAIVQPLTPPALERVVRKCLAKDPDSRWQSAHDLLDDLKWVAEGPGVSGPTAPAVVQGHNPSLPWFVAAASLIVAILAVAGMLFLRRAAPESVVTRVDIATPATTDPFSFALSADGRQLAFVANADGRPLLWVRSLDQVTARSLPGTEGANYPFWSPDGRAIGFFADAKLKRIDLTGGAPQVLADASAGRGGTWNRDGVIVFGSNTRLMRVAATGGTPSAVTEPTAGQGSHRWPQFLPDGRRFLFSVALGQLQPRGVYIGSLDGGAVTRVLAADASAAYAPPGYLLLVSQGVLVAHRFDPTSGSVGEDTIPLAQAVGIDPSTAHGGFSVSETGVLAHRGVFVAQRQLVWVDRTGKSLGVLGPVDDASPVDPELTPDGRRVAVNRIVEGNPDIWLFEVARGIMGRFTSDAALDTQPIWSPDGSRIVFRSSRNGRFDLFEKPANGAADEQPLLVTALDKGPQDWSSDGRVLLYAIQDPKTQSDLWALPLTGDRKPFPVAQTSFDEAQGQLSPDGRWVTYVSNETGHYETYVRPFPGPGAKVPISTGGGIYPRWRRDGREIFYVAPGNQLMAVPIQVGSDTRTLNPSAPVALFPTRLATGSNVWVGGYNSRPQYAVAPDGRFLMNVAVEDTAASPITLVLNWTATLKK